MGAFKTKLSAELASKQMKTMGFIPKTILNIGVGPSHAEKGIWLRDFPNSYLIGVDIRGAARWGKPFIKALVSSEECQDATFCWCCKSIKCNDSTHEKHKKLHTNVTTIDKIVEDKQLEPPFFIWMDIEGAELEALKGAKQTLLKTKLINIEMREFPWTNNDYCDKLHSFLTNSKFKMINLGEVIEAHKLEDRLYKRID